MDLKKLLPQNLIVFIISLGLGFLIYFINPFQLEASANIVLPLTVVMIVLWISEALPMPVVALIPIFYLPFTGILKIDEVTKGFSNPVIYLFLGGFFLSLAIEKWNLHKRIALNIVRFTGTSGNRMILGFIISTAFLSMWLSNTATTMMMFPIALSVIQIVKKSDITEKQIRNFSFVLMIVIAYASNFGGIATLIGTPPNVAFISFIKSQYQEDMSFIKWMMICTPISIIILFSLYFFSTKVLYPNHIKSSKSAEEFIHNEIQQLGRMDGNEKRVAVVFILTASLWIFKDVINRFLDVQFDDTQIALLGGILLFIIPAKNQAKSTALLTWNDTNQMAWGILLIFGGGITLAGALEKVGLLTLMGKQISGLSQFGIPVLIISITLISIFLSEVMSNIAQVIVLTPIICEISNQLQINPMLLGLPMTLAASCASMLPMGTPPNAIVFSSGLIPIKEMVRFGFLLNIICVIVISLFSIFLLPMIL